MPGERKRLVFRCATTWTTPSLAWSHWKLRLRPRIRSILRTGKAWADRQWENPRPDGLSAETRFWIDDMYMLTILQLEAYRATGDKKYLDRDAVEMAAYLDKLQQPNGLFFHAPDVPVLLGPRRRLGRRRHGGDAARSAPGPSAARAHSEGYLAMMAPCSSIRARTACGGN